MGKFLKRLVKGAQDKINRIKEEIDPLGEQKRKEDAKIEDMKSNPDKYEKLEDTLICIKRDEEGRLLIFNRITNVKDAREIAFEIDTIMMQFRMVVLAKAAAMGAQTPGGIILPGVKK